ncbi:DNA-binding protein WhiA [Agathobacter sp.]|jgi:DNA-binding protein WhiA|uniref:DNA-binding protein WhiA n=1 Tax=Agathobacter sp. TaxID=2021311 RepID=UPI0027F6DB5E|nr:DNA-binding protein WhiA [Agathobacter rectalis]
MSFSSDVKKELLGQVPRSRHCQLAELAGIINMDGAIDKDTGCLVLESENELVIHKYEVLMKKAFSVDAGSPLTQGDTKRIMSALKLEKPGYAADGLILMQTCCKRAYLRGVFMAAGSISNPQKSYHFEIVCKSSSQAEQIQEILKGFDTDAKIVGRKSHYVVYLKEGSNIVDCLNVMEAYVSLMNLENVRILKEMRNSVNRKVNCETANIKKTVNAAVKQIEDIELIRDKTGLEKLPDVLKETARLRLEYPEATLKELGGYFDPPVGKSGVNHRLKKLSAIAEELR